MNLRNIWTIAVKDLKQYFTSPIGYIVVAVFTFIMGWMFFQVLSYFNLMNMQYTQYGRGPSITDGIIKPLYGNMNVIFLFVVPFITMRLFSEEMKNKTLELLITSPISKIDLVLGKFLSSYLFMMLTILPTIIYPAILLVTGNPDIAPILTSYLGVSLMVGCYLVIGVFCSSLTENQIIAAVLTFGAILFFWIISWAAHSVGPTLSDIINYVSIMGHFQSFSKGILDLSDAVFYVTFMGFGLYLTYQSVDSYSWR